MLLRRNPEWSGEPFSDSLALQSEAAELGFDWPNVDGVLEKAREELDELEEAIRSGDRDAIRHELGDIILAIVNIARVLDLAPGDVLREANERFLDRFLRMQERLQARGRRVSECSLDALNLVWEQVKRER